MKLRNIRKPIFEKFIRHLCDALMMFAPAAYSKRPPSRILRSEVRHVQPVHTHEVVIFGADAIRRSIGGLGAEHPDLVSALGQETTHVSNIYRRAAAIIRRIHLCDVPDFELSQAAV
jgi:hypothetical protein